MKKILYLIFLFSSGSAQADVPKNQAKEVSHLLQFVKNSQCKINRNGAEHSGDKSYKHIENKYDYFRDDIKSTEDFIKYAATKSTMSGSYYEVTCPNKKTIKSRDWLLQELKRFRDKKSKLDKAEIEVTICESPRPQVCTMEYVPVCATLKNKQLKTYASGCSACADVKVVNYKKGACE
ncbi:hypothetical protein MNBD_GAMMA08-2665 [hydrothermal vent metagenome]|uniref:Kazal-like domain-containing protein n=1 Tax=hydrothermal vent metagenome TaxID=652676 RepID=A0A3B0X4D8_9ZZZZ